MGAVHLADTKISFDTNKLHILLMPIIVQLMLQILLFLATRHYYIANYLPLVLVLHIGIPADTSFIYPPHWLGWKHFIPYTSKRWGENEKRVRKTTKIKSYTATVVVVFDPSWSSKAAKA